MTQSVFLTIPRTVEERLGGFPWSGGSSPFGGVHGGWIRLSLSQLSICQAFTVRLNRVVAHLIVLGENPASGKPGPEGSPKPLRSANDPPNFPESCRVDLVRGGPCKVTGRASGGGIPPRPSLSLSRNGYYIKVVAGWKTAAKATMESLVCALWPISLSGLLLSPGLCRHQNVGFARLEERPSPS